MRNAYEASGIIIDVLPVVMFHSGVCVCVCVCVFIAKWNWEFFKGKDRHISCFVSCFQNDRNWRYKVKTILNLESDDLGQFFISHVTLNKIPTELLLPHLENENISAYTTVMKNKWNTMCENKNVLQTCKSYISLNNIFVFTLIII